MTWSLLLALLPVLPFVVWAALGFLAASGTERVAPLGDGDAPREAVLVLTAHPDDECMFFAPTILALASSGSVDVHVLCLSNGNAEGLGRVREKELVASCKTLGVSASRVVSLNHEKLQDSMTVDWDRDTIAAIVVDHVAKHRIDAIVTFDSQGISGHTNHRALFHAMSAATRAAQIAVPVYTLETVPVVRKFAALLDVVWTVATHSMALARDTDGIGNPRRLFLLSPYEYMTAREAMFKHRSQLVWFRYLYLVFSRYMVVNVLDRIN
ncbi:N-acetylglucosaminyl-phosphatidylinositol de-N-acetylase [Polyrhizophydium stewartii]|uniref:N-acetylglucosaminylphosphatidylinositol deacetylase n=1 Tax=Polyrhizophydium stewartii TaxID=2732419 RepID=A0ABR4NAL6_9FUNG|nr:hypothetical protein HK105_006186 [Polyrhizophydium stewartii]